MVVICIGDREATAEVDELQSIVPKSLPNLHGEVANTACCADEEFKIATLRADVAVEPSKPGVAGKRTHHSFGVGPSHAEF